MARRELALHRFGEVRLRAVARDELGMTHVRFDRMVAGIPLDGEQLIVHYDRHGGLRALSGPTDRPTLPPAGGATIDRVVAVASARAVTDAGAMVRALDLVAHRSQEGLRRAFSIDLRWTRPDGSPAGANVVVDAVSGAVLEQTAAARTAVAHSLHSGQVTLETTPVPGGFVLRDPTRGNSETRDARQQRPSSTPGFPATSTEIIDTDDQWGTPTDDRRNDVAVDAQHAAAVAWDFLRDMFGRDSLDNRGMAIRSNVHAGTNLIGAYWLDGQVFYGDGDGHTADPMVSLDFGLHEIFHGLTENTARLKKRGEPGALNEATSDILQAAARWWHARRMGNESIDWWLGRTTWTPGIGNDAARYMDHPSRDRPHSQYDLYDRDHYAHLYRLQHDSGGVHMNAGIANNFFYLLVNGGTNDTSGVTVRDGIGMEKGARIWYRALTTYMTPTTRFADARVATLLAAQDLYGGDSAEARRVAEAWNAVGVAGPE
ncbi:MAG TPA: M4 family metallopeptidase [Myxococcota bacterium]|nr:M4 family metallopeptidase [Myxococcota bacterium]